MVNAESHQAQEDHPSGNEDDLPVLIPEKEGIEAGINDLLLVGRFGLACIGWAGHNGDLEIKGKLKGGR